MTARMVPPASSDRISYWAGHAVHEPVGLAMHGSQRVAYERTVAATRVALGEERFAATWARGKAMTTEQAVEHALSAAD